MTARVDCPHCAVRLRIPAERIGAQARCPACGESFELKTSEGQADRTEGGPAKAPEGKHALFDRADDVGRSSEARSPLSVNDVRIPTLLAGVYALGITVVLAILIRMAIPESFVARLFSHGLISFFTALLGVWAACILALKSRWLAFEKRALRFDVLSQEAEEVIRPANVHRFTSHIQALPAKFRGTILFRRISRALEYFRATGSGSGVSAYLSSQNDLDTNASESSYTMVRAFIWAVPILGFIGTVFGIGEAVNSFAVSVDSAQDVEAIRSSLGGVTGGLGTAFETTLVALVLSIFLMIPTNWLQKTEDELLTAVGSYCNEELIWRFEQGVGVGPGGLQAAPPLHQPEALRDAMGHVVEQAQALGVTLKYCVDSVREGVDATAKKLEEGLSTPLTELHEKVSRCFDATSEVLAAQEAMRQRFAEAAEAESMESLMLKVNETHGRMAEVFERMAQIKPKRWWRLWR